MFQWQDVDNTMRSTADLLRNCLLSVKVDGYQPAIIRLREPKHVRPLTFAFLETSKPQTISDPIHIESLPTTNIKFTLELSHPQKDWKTEEVNPLTSNLHICKLLDFEVVVHRDAMKKPEEWTVAVKYLGAGSQGKIQPASIQPLLNKDNDNLKNLRQKDSLSDLEKNELASLKQTIAELIQLKEAFGVLRQTELQYRVYMTIDNYTVDLITTEQRK